MGEPDPYADSFAGLVTARALTGATLLGVFDALHEEPAAPAELAERLSLDPLGAETLLTTLLTLGYVEAGAGGRFANSAVSERLLVSSSPESIATFVGAQADLHWEVLHELPRAVRDGWAYAMHEERQDDSERWQAYIRGLFEISRPEHDANAALVPLTDARRLVDVAGGHGGFAMAMCRRHPRLEATVLDLPPSVPWAGGSWRSRAMPSVSRSARVTCSSSGSASSSTWCRCSTSSITCPRSATASCAGWRGPRCGRAACS